MATNDGHSLIELKAVVRMLNVMLDIAEEEGEDSIQVSDVQELRNKYEREISALERFNT